MMTNPSKPLFWRDSRMPYLELRSVADGRKVHYAPHSHIQWSIGAITEGRSTFIYQGNQFTVSAGDLVIMNPNWVHACNPISNNPWSYLMLYVDIDWLTKLRYETGAIDTPIWKDILTPIISDYDWYTGYCQMVECLFSPNRRLLEKQTAVVTYLTALMHQLAEQVVVPQANTPRKLQAIADYLKAHAFDEVSLDILCKHSDYSPGHLIRSFKNHFGLTPHQYLINYRIQCGQRELKLGKPIAEVAFNAGFSDQPHFQRIFKKLVAATPKQYQEVLLNQNVDATRGK